MVFMHEICNYFIFSANIKIHRATFKIDLKFLKFAQILEIHQRIKVTIGLPR
jgi:hypothetical protein